MSLRRQETIGLPRALMELRFPSVRAVAYGLRPTLPWLFRGIGRGSGHTVMKCSLPALVLVFLAACTTPQQSQAKPLLQYPQRSWADWQPDKAVAEARSDIAAGHPKIYLCGTIVAFAPGVDFDRHPVLKTLPCADAGIGCLVSDGPLRRAQSEYARRYNEHIAGHYAKIQTEPSKSPIQASDY